MDIHEGMDGPASSLNCISFGLVSWRFGRRDELSVGRGIVGRGFVLELVLLSCCFEYLLWNWRSGSALGV